MNNKIARKWSTFFEYSVKHLVLILMSLINIYPIYYIFINAFKTRTAYADDPLSFPFEPVVYNFVKVFATPNFLRWFMNSLLLTVVTVFGCLFISALAAYALSKMHFPGRRFLSNSSIALMVVPTIVMIIPLFVLMAKIHLVNKYPSAIIIYIWYVSPFFDVSVSQFFYNHTAGVDRCSLD